MNLFSFLVVKTEYVQQIPLSAVKWPAILLCRSVCQNRAKRHRLRCDVQSINQSMDETETTSSSAALNKCRCFGNYSNSSSIVLSATTHTHEKGRNRKKTQRALGHDPIHQQLDRCLYIYGYWVTNRSSSKLPAYKRNGSQWPCLLSSMQNKIRRQSDLLAAPSIHSHKTSPMRIKRDQYAMLWWLDDGGWWVTPEKWTVFPIAMWTELPKVASPTFIYIYLLLARRRAQSDSKCIASYTHYFCCIQFAPSDQDCWLMQLHSISSQWVQVNNANAR